MNSRLEPHEKELAYFVYKASGIAQEIGTNLNPLPDEWSTIHDDHFTFIAHGHDLGIDAHLQISDNSSGTLVKIEGYGDFPYQGIIFKDNTTWLNQPLCNPPANPSPVIAVTTHDLILGNENFGNLEFLVGDDPALTMEVVTLSFKVLQRPIEELSRKRNK